MSAEIKRIHLSFKSGQFYFIFNEILWREELNNLDLFSFSGKLKKWKMEN